MNKLPQRQYLSLIVAGFIVLSAFFTLNSHADEVYTFIVKKQEEKAKTRWSLSEWLETRDKMRLMDLWLAMHSPSPYEFYLSGSYLTGENAGSSRYKGWDLSAAAYASIFGLGFERQTYSGVSESSGLFFLRVFGFHSQGTNITLQGGISNADRMEGRFRGGLAGVASTIYLGKYFGLDGLYRHSFDSVPNDSPVRLSGSRYEGGAFIDFKFLRVIGKYFSATTELSSGGERRNSGVSAGIQLYF